MFLIGIFFLYFGFDFFVFPRSRHVKFASTFEFFLGLKVGVEDPLLVGSVEQGPDVAGSLIEDLHFFGCELAIEDFEVFAG